MPRAGWASRQIENTRRDVESWPRWMKREAGLCEDRIYIVHAVFSHGDSEQDVGIIAFDSKEAKEKVGELLNGRVLSVDHPGPKWAVVDARELLPIRGFVAIMRAVYVLQQTGIQVYEIHQDGKKEDLRVCPARERITADRRIGLDQMGSPSK